jgi:hypothetical protein
MSRRKVKTKNSSATLRRCAVCLQRHPAVLYPGKPGEDGEEPRPIWRMREHDVGTRQLGKAVTVRCPGSLHPCAQEVTGTTTTKKKIKLYRDAEESK